MIIDKLEERLTIRYPSSYIKKVHIDKADKDIKRSSLFAKLSKSISCAVQLGGPDPCIE